MSEVRCESRRELVGGLVRHDPGVVLAGQRDRGHVPALAARLGGTRRSA